VGYNTKTAKVRKREQKRIKKYSEGYQALALASYKQYAFEI